MTAAVVRLEQIEEFVDAGSHYRPIRHHLGVTAFGVTAWAAHAGGERVINEHDPDDPTADEELFLVLSGHAVFKVDGESVDAPVGTLVFVPAGTQRTATATEDGTTILAVEGTPGRRMRRAVGSCGLRSPRTMRLASSWRSPTAWVCWCQPTRSTRCCFSTSPAAKANAGAPARPSITSGVPSTCPRSSASRPGKTPTWIRSATNPPSGDWYTGSRHGGSQAKHGRSSARTRTSSAHLVRRLTLRLLVSGERTLCPDSGGHPVRLFAAFTTHSHGCGRPQITVGVASGRPSLVPER